MTRDELAIEFLKLLRRRSTCRRNQVACFVADRELRCIYAVGYNGPARGEPESACKNLMGRCECVHDASNALVKLRTDQANLVLATTTSPCLLCAKLIVNCGQIATVAYVERYRDDSPAGRVLAADGVLLQPLGMGVFVGQPALSVRSVSDSGQRYMQLQYSNLPVFSDSADD